MSGTRIQHNRRVKVSAPASFTAKREWDVYRRDHECAAAGKAQFRSSAAASKFAKDNRSRGGFVQYVYQCPTCRQWHLTSRPPRPKKGTP